MMKTCLFVALSVMAGIIPVFGEIKTEPVTVFDGDEPLDGFFAYDAAIPGKRPGVLIIHDWMGLKEYEMSRARQIAELGYLAYAMDMYGKGKRPKQTQEASEMAKLFRENRDLMRSRAQSGLEALQKHSLCEVSKVAAMGYCFGGGVSLELARYGAPLAGVISFHGNLDTPNIMDAKNIKGKVLILHGADDPLVPPEQIAAFQREMREANVDWQFIQYGGAVHSFTNPSAGTDPSKGAAYHAISDRRSWEHLKLFLKELFEH